MKRHALILGAAGILGLVGVSNAQTIKKPGANPPPSTPIGPQVTPPPTPTPKVAAVPAYMKPTADGSVGPSEPTPVQSVTLKCMADYAPKFKGQTGHCWMDRTRPHTYDALCKAGSRVVTDDKLPVIAGHNWGQVDQCLADGSDPRLKESYTPAFCQTSPVNYTKTVKAGPDKCSADVRTVAAHTPGLGAMPGAIANSPTQAEIDQRSVKCPAGWTLKAEENYFVCLRN